MVPLDIKIHISFVIFLVLVSNSLHAKPNRLFCEGSRSVSSVMNSPMNSSTKNLKLRGRIYFLTEAVSLNDYQNCTPKCNHDIRLVIPNLEILRKIRTQIYVNNKLKIIKNVVCIKANPAYVSEKNNNGIYGNSIQSVIVLDVAK
jgi:hypothetical protein